MEENYRILVRYLKLWQRYVKLTKQRRKDKKEMVKKIAKAIHFHEQQLQTKTLLSFIKQKVSRAQLAINAVKTIERVRWNLKKFYM